MGKNTRWSADDLKKKGLAQNASGDYVPVKSLVAKGKVEKLPTLINGPTKIGLPTKVIESIEGKTVYTPNLNTHTYFGLPNGELITVKHFFDINPCPAPRMTRSDQWKVDPFYKDPEKRQRPVITRYFAWRDAFRLLSSQKGYVLDERLHAVFVFPFPEYFSKKKRANLLHQPHKQRPDADNNAKSIMDCFGVDDGYVWDLRAVKIWGEKGQILIF